MPPAAKYRWYHVRLATLLLFAFFFGAGVGFQRLSNPPIDEPPDFSQSTKDSVFELTLRKLAIEEKLRISTASGAVAERNQRLALRQIEDIDFAIRLACEDMQRVRQQVASLNK